MGLEKSGKLVFFSKVSELSGKFENLVREKSYFQKSGKSQGKMKFQKKISVAMSK
jgi:hypothetical protein